MEGQVTVVGVPLMWDTVLGLGQGQPCLAWTEDATILKLGTQSLRLRLLVDPPQDM